ncbi:hypothetical protein SAMN05444397_103468 [Flavobacterium aquidurense]|uniref:Outer membrane protein beta-barrel domain-containing protein n=1 Tax=Flavobacterium frigidimaris TaxID=262320 RepID=A0ABX4BMC1_FLAFR|nr:hypothetical protein [Flavobacterium frigidimaris]OXA77313.1 hypothetical protein B0A65_16810 [Flavobacterium frigidimaris]SDZ11057.1 hypothetical protein SAMN05444397_103468 [Flavobacterium aquidurense]
MKKQNIEDIFSSMENFSSVPPPELWANIEEKLDQPKKKKRAILWWSAAACLLLGLLLPSVLYFSSNTGIKTLENNTGGNNNVVIEENKKDNHDIKVISTEEKSIEKKSGIVEGTSAKTSKDKTANTNENQTKEVAIAHSDSKNKRNTDSSDIKLNSQNSATNQAVTQQTTASEKRSQFNSFSKNKNLNSEKTNTNQVVAQKTFTTGNHNQFNSFSKNQNAFNSAEKNQFSETEKRNADKILAEKTFTTGKQQNHFNSPSKNQMSNSIFENQMNSNTNSIASNSSDSNLGKKQVTITDNKKEVAATTTIKTEKTVADSAPKSNSKFSNVLSKQDSVQLAELQNLEKGIIPEVKKGKEKDPKTKSTAEKWALEVFAGIANSENYKNDKTLGNVNDSKQSSTYGVKTKYKINKKWAVGSGFKINELGQSVANVSYIKTANNAFLTTGDYLVQNSTVPQIASSDSYVLVSNTTKNALSSNNVQSGSLDQSLRYVEMPLEVSYAIFSKNKASISLNTGGFVGKLISNSVAIDGNSLGENLNANDFVYGSTLSSTVQYRVYKKTNVFVEPAMNYYINPLNSQSFNQFQWGLNFGLNVSF